MDKLTLLEDAREGACHARGELHLAFYRRVECVVSTFLDVPSNVDTGTTLAHENFSRTNGLTVGTLHAQALCVGIVNVLGGPTRLLMCHRGRFRNDGTEERRERIPFWRMELYRRGANASSPRGGGAPGFYVFFCFYKKK